MGRSLARRLHRRTELAPRLRDNDRIREAGFGRAKVREFGPSDIRRLLDFIRKEIARRTPKGKKPREVTAATLARHLRQLGACLEASIAEGYATENPVRKLHKTAWPRVTKSRPASTPTTS